MSLTRSSAFLPGFISILAVLIAAGSAVAAPEIRRLYNAAGHRPVFAPGGALARGALIVIEGERIGPATQVLAQRDPVEDLAGVSVAMLSDLGSQPLLLSRVGATSIDAVIPADAVAGIASITVTYAGQTSAPVRAPIVPSALSLFRVSEAEGGPQKAGSEMTLWATGLGEARADDLEVFVGGVPARVLAAQRAAAPGGRDRIEIALPANSPIGCHTPVQARLYGSLPSNVIAIPTEQPCESSGRAPRAAGGLVGLVLLLRAEMYVELFELDSELVTFTSDSAFGAFAPSDKGRERLAPFVALPPAGSCTAYSSFFQTSELSDLPSQAWESALRGAPTAGVGEIEISGKTRRRSVASDEPFQRYADLLGGTHPYNASKPLPKFFEPGAFTITGSGGDGIGGFTATASMPRAVLWRNPGKFETVDRDEDLVLEWESGPREAPVVVAGIGLDRRTQSGALFICRQEAAKERLAVPSAILQMIAPAGPSGRGHIGMVFVGSGFADNPPVFQTEGISFGTVVTLNVSGRSVTFR
jgi:uncharacterized protein (TIGR03437 family)